MSQRDVRKLREEEALLAAVRKAWVLMEEQVGRRRGGFGRRTMMMIVRIGGNAMDFWFRWLLPLLLALGLRNHSEVLQRNAHPWH
jgi:hypothetical protein